MKFKITIIITFSLILILGFQNCGGVNFSQKDNPSNVSQGPGNPGVGGPYYCQAIAHPYLQLTFNTSAITTYELVINGDVVHSQCRQNNGSNYVARDDLVYQYTINYDVGDEKDLPRSLSVQLYEVDCYDPSSRILRSSSEEFNVQYEEYTLCNTESLRLERTY